MDHFDGAMGMDSDGLRDAPVQNAIYPASSLRSNHHEVSLPLSCFVYDLDFCVAGWDDPR
jgi:hypothetical protein